VNAGGQQVLEKDLVLKERNGEQRDLGISTRSKTGVIRRAVNPCAAPTSAIKTTESSNGTAYGRT